MSIKNDMIKNIGDIIISVISSDVSNKITNMSNRFQLWNFKKRMRRSIKEFIIKNDGTVLTKGSFFGVLEYHHPIDKIYNYISEPNKQSKDEIGFLRNLASMCKESIIGSGDFVSVEDECLIFELFKMVYLSYKEFLSKQLNLKEYYIVSEVKQSQYVITELANDVMRERRDINSIIHMLKEQDRIKDSSVIWNIYECLNKELWYGKLEEVRKLWPIVEGKNQSLENGIYIKVQVLTENNLNEEDIIKRWELIKDVRIRNDVARHLILENITNKGFLERLLRNLEEGSLKQIVTILIDENWDEIISLKSVCDNVIKEYQYSLTDSFKDEEWIVRRIAVLYLSKQPIYNIGQTIEKLISANGNFIDKLFVINQRVENEAQCIIGKMAADKKRILEKYQEYLIENEQAYLSANMKIQEVFCMTLFRTMFILDNGDIMKYYDKLSENLRANKNIQEFKMAVDIEAGTITEDQVIQFCLSNDHYWLLNNYLLQFSKNPEKIILVLDKCKIVLEKDVELFLLYVRAVKLTKGENDAILILDRYKSQYGQYLNYWVMYTGLSKAVSIDEIYQKWLDKELIEYGLYVDVEFANMLMQYDKYEEAGKVISKLEALQISTPSLLRMKSKVLLEEGFELDALKLLLNIFDGHRDDPYVVDSIIVISLNNRRKIASEVIEAAVKIGSARLLMLAANAYEITNDHSNAILMITRALLKADTQNIDIYGKYLGIHVKIDTDKIREISCIDADTAVYLRNREDNSEKIYCIYSEKVLPSEPYVWENAIHIYKDTAIGMSLFRKKTSDEINIDGQQYEIKEIMPVDCFLFRTCLRNMCEEGVVQQYSLPIDSKGELDYEDFSKWIKKNIPEPDEKHEWLNGYKNPNNIPVPFYRLQSFTRLSYAQLIMAFMDERTIIIRDLLHMQDKTGVSFVLSFAAVVMLYKIGVDIKYLLNMDVVISESTLNEMVAEEDEIYRANNKKTVATMRVIDDHILIQEANEDEKLKVIQDATGLKVYVQQIPNTKNESDIRIDELKKLNMKDTFGICDYDTLAIARKEKRLFVSGEIFNSSLAQIESSQIAAVSIVDFMSMIKIPVDEFLDYLIEMVNYQFAVFLTPKIIKYLMQEVELITDDNTKEKVMEKWIDCLALGDGMEAEYKSVFIQMLTDTFKNMYEQYSISDNAIWRVLITFVMKYNNIRLKIRMPSLFENGD